MGEREFFDALLQSVQEMDGIVRGSMPPSRVFDMAAPPMDVRAVREKTGLSQNEFARLLRVKVQTLQNWEQQRRAPSGPAAALLTLAAKAPEVVLQALHA